VNELTCAPLKKKEEFEEPGMRFLELIQCGGEAWVSCFIASLHERNLVQLSRALLLARGHLKFAFQQSVRGAGGFQLLKAPFQNQLAEISDRALLLSSKRRKLVSKSLADPKADLGFPFTHPVPSCKRDSVGTQGNQWIWWFPWCR